MGTFSLRTQVHSERLAFSSSQLNLSLAKWTRAASRKIEQRTSDGHESLLSIFLSFFRLTRREIAGMQSCRGYLYVGLSVAAISAPYPRECRTRKTEPAPRYSIEAARASEARSCREKCGRTVSLSHTRTMEKLERSSRCVGKPGENISQEDKS